MIERVRELAAQNFFKMQVSGKPWVYCPEHRSNPALKVEYEGATFNVCEQCFNRCFDDVVDAKCSSTPAPVVSGVVVKCANKDCTSTTTRLSNCCFCRRPFCAVHLVSQAACGECLDADTNNYY